jgi:hypothetical protein
VAKELPAYYHRHIDRTVAQDNSALAHILALSRLSGPRTQILAAAALYNTDVWWRRGACLTSYISAGFNGILRFLSPLPRT